MRVFSTEQLGKLIIVHLGKGEDVLLGVRKALESEGVENAVLVSAIGSLRRASLHGIMSTEDNPTNRFRTFEKPIELGTAQGIVLEGIPHFHLCISTPDETYTGHMEEGCLVQYLAELCLIEFRGLDLERKSDEFGIQYISQREE